MVPSRICSLPDDWGIEVEENEKKKKKEKEHDWSWISAPDWGKKGIKSKGKERT